MIFLHIGAQKTGSTTIQKALYDCRDELKSDNLYYADVLPDDPNKVSHYNSVRGFFSDSAKEKAAVKAFVDQFDDSSKNYIISAENLSNWPNFRPGGNSSGEEYVNKKKEIVHNIREEFRNHEVAVIFYIRDRAAFLKSLFKQHLKVNYEASRSLDQSLHLFMKRELIRSDFGVEAKIWQDEFEKVHILDYDKYKKSGLLDSFSACIKYKSTLRTSEDLNISPNWAILEKRRIENSLGADIKISDTKKAQIFDSETEHFVSGVIASYLAKGL